MNEHHTNRLNSLQDVALRLPKLYSESSAKAYTAAFNRVEKLSGQRLAHLPADEVAWADMSARIVWAGHFKGRTQQATERAFEAWRGKISAAIKRARAQMDRPADTGPAAVQASQAWDLIHGYVTSVENTFDDDGNRILPNMSSLSVSNLRARLNTHLPASLTTEVVEAALTSLPANKIATFRRSVHFFDKLVAARAQHTPIADFLPIFPLGPLRSLRDARIVWTQFPASFQMSLEQMIKIAIRGYAPGHDPLADRLGPDPLAARRAARRDRRKPVRNIEVATSSYKAALSWLARHGNADRNEIYKIADVRDLLTAKIIDRAVARYVHRSKNDSALLEVQATSSLGSYLATLSTLARTSRLDDSVLHAIEDARWDTETWSPYSNQMSTVREAFVKKLDRDPGLVRSTLEGPRILMQEAQQDLARWDHLSSRARSQALHLAMAAAMLAIQLARPLRTKNINELTIWGPTPHLSGPKNKGNDAWLDIGRDKIKNRRVIESPLPRDTWQIVSAWIDEGRPRWLELHAARNWTPNIYLFPGSSENETICRQTLNTAWNRGVARLGLTGMTPHMMRHFAATVFLARHPGQYGAVADLLGDRPETVEAFYARGAGHAAAKLLAQVLQELDPGSKLGGRKR